MNKQVMIGSIDFSGHEEMYESFKLRVEADTWLKNYVIFNENSHVVWVCWHNKEVI